MKYIIDLLSGKTTEVTGCASSNLECNYGDNYYGDQVCITKPLAAG